jgi:hypothetical protein
MKSMVSPGIKDREQDQTHGASNGEANCNDGAELVEPFIPLEITSVSKPAL